MVISMLRNISALALVIIVIRGVFKYDNRFTVLLLPPFLFYYHVNTPGWIQQLPFVRIMNKLHNDLANTFGTWSARIVFAGAGVLAGLYLGGVWKPT